MHPSSHSDDQTNTSPSFARSPQGVVSRTPPAPGSALGVPSAQWSGIGRLTVVDWQTSGGGNLMRSPSQKALARIRPFSDPQSITTSKQPEPHSNKKPEATNGAMSGIATRSGAFGREPRAGAPVRNRRTERERVANLSEWSRAMSLERVGGAETSWC